MKYISYIVTSQSVLFVTMFSPAVSVSSSSLPAFFSFFSFFSAPSFRAFYNLWTVLRGVFHTHRPNESFSLALLFLSFLFCPLSFLSPLFSFFLSSLLFLFSSLPADFWCGDRRMPHRFRRPWGTPLNNPLIDCCALLSKCRLHF